MAYTYTEENRLMYNQEKKHYFVVCLCRKLNFILEDTASGEVRTKKLLLLTSRYSNLNESYTIDGSGVSTEIECTSKGPPTYIYTRELQHTIM